MNIKKYEANLVKADEAIFLQSKFNCQKVMEIIERQWGPFDKDEINFYMHELRNDNGEIMNGFQKQLVFNLFYKYFGDTSSPNAINSIDYIKLMLAAKKILKDNMMGFLPYIISSKVDKIASRKTLNKKEQVKMEASQYYQLTLDKYKNDKIQRQILGTIATIITSSFRIIDFDKNNTELKPGCNGELIKYTGPMHGKPINVETDIIIEEALLYILLI